MAPSNLIAALEELAKKRNEITSAIMTLASIAGVDAAPYLERGWGELRIDGAPSGGAIRAREAAERALEGRGANDARQGPGETAKPSVARVPSDQRDGPGAQGRRREGGTDSRGGEERTEEPGRARQAARTDDDRRDVSREVAQEGGPRGLQRRAADTAGEPAVAVEFSDVGELEDEVEAFELPEPEYTAPKKRGRPFNAFKPGTRQLPKPLSVPEGELPWYARTKPGEMTKTAEARQTVMSNSKEGLRISGSRISYT